jgi:purine-nucleoside phosphorylase
MGSTPVVCMQGRFHSYEGYTLAVCCMPVKLFKLLGCRMMLATNAAGSLNPAYEPGDLMVIKDHFSVPMLTMQHPLMGPNDPRFGNRFVPANKIYDRELRRAFLDAASRLNARVHEGVYGVIGGPAYESVTDARFLQNQGCDCSGMSTSHESMVASYCGKINPKTNLKNLFNIPFY